MYRYTLFLLTACLLAAPAAAQSRKELRGQRQRGWSEQEVQRWLDYQGKQRLVMAPYQDECPDLTARRDAIMNGNRITAQITNFGSISSPGNTITDIVWNGLGYGYEFGPFVAAEIVDEGHQDPKSVLLRDASGNVVLDENGDSTWVMHIISDGLVSNGGEVSPDGSDWWGWHPIPCAEPVGNFEGIQVVNPNSDKVPTSDDRDADLDGKPDSWPDDWYNANLGEYVWPGALQQGASNADKEALYFMNDYRNLEFEYQPFIDNPSIKGLGLEVEVRFYQWANPLAEDALFMIYKITNKSDKDLDKVTFGMWGDPHVGGPSNFNDDLAFFDRDLNMVYAWDADGRSDVAGRPPGYFGYKFLESPGRGNEIISGVLLPGDGIDNDGDGMIDESWTDGIDNDADWNIDLDDLGIDGVGSTGDPGESDGVPTAGDPFDITKPGEPNFESTDIDESDMIGLTSFASPPFAGNSISNDERVWELVTPGRFDDVPAEPGDYVFIYGAGTFPLRAGETKRFSIALLLGENLEDLILNARTVQQIYDVGYRFAKPPEKPVVRAAAGDKKVTLYWDQKAEESVDPLTGEKDFEGYVIYRSTDPQFSDIQTITDINGSKFLFQPLTNERGIPAKFDLDNGLSGPSEIPYANRGIAYDLGDDTGLYHTYVDSNNVVNGQTYYYAVVAYDRGYAGDAGAGFTGGIPPSETSKTITYNPTTDAYIFDDNTVRVIPAPRVAGYVPPGLTGEDGLRQTAGSGTGAVRLEIIDEMRIDDANPYRIEFDLVDGGVVYSVFDEKPVELAVTAPASGAAALGYAHIDPSSFQLRTADGVVLQAGQAYTLNDSLGILNIIPGGGIQTGQELTATFTHAPIFQSEYVAGEEANPVFDGIHLFVDADELAYDSLGSGWISGSGPPAAFGVATSGPGRIRQPADYEIRFADEPVTTSVAGGLGLPFQIFNVTDLNNPKPIESLVVDTNPRNGQWDLGEKIVFVETIDDALIATWEVRFPDSEGAAVPGAGDVLFLRTFKPFTAADAFAFTTAAADADMAAAGEALDEIYVVPNPYVATNEIEPRNPISNTERGDRRLYFANVPQRCTIRIYTLAGELVDVIEHDSALDDGKAFWDLRTKDNVVISYGLYIFHVESEAGSRVGKFAVIK